MSVITLTTDFGSLYPASMKGVILSINPDATIVDISHSVPPADIMAGAFALYSVVRYFPQGTIHVGVIDPGVGSDRKAIIVKAGGQWFVGPDNGLLIPPARLLGEIEVYEIIEEGLSGHISSTFHGRDIFAPAAAYLSTGRDVLEIARKTDGYVYMDFSGYNIEKEFIEATVVYVDDFGNIITNIPGEKILDEIKVGTVLSISGRQMPLLNTYSGVSKWELVALVGSHGFFEIAVNQGSASRLLQLGNGGSMRIGIMSRS
ncbi:S-adenosyl-l-methionine hydroxide adenosyltransferase family protein [Methanolobus vulcani]|uniref:SAM-dependent chlorinase/fluorinase n=1 Tax=Methanolobus vulcani TaxID=38026 RepID=A0A7Z8P5D8_9EURY|nr:S-adenosyl-l-methionine hydroxide adenosyltransferase family protein [Methanolobus vulcani]TQD28231.1 SAM-dependent chlorinase/fluorinase [Methanolobus vulcani]